MKRLYLKEPIPHPLTGEMVNVISGGKGLTIAKADGEYHVAHYTSVPFSNVRCFVDMPLQSVGSVPKVEPKPQPKKRGRRKRRAVDSAGSS